MKLPIHTGMPVIIENSSVIIITVTTTQGILSCNDAPLKELILQTKFVKYCQTINFDASKIFLCAPFVFSKYIVTNFEILKKMKRNERVLFYIALSRTLVSKLMIS